MHSVHRLASGAILLALAGSTAAPAMPPPLPVNARYGPVMQCLGGYRVAVTAQEAISVGADVTLITDRYLLRLVETAGGHGGSKVTQVVHPGLGPIDRVVAKVVRTDNGGFRVIGKQPKLPRFTIAYRLPALGGGSPVAVSSSRFTGTDADFAMLSRVARVEPTDTCGAFGPPDFAEENPAALRWSPVAVPGPAYRCQNGVGFAVKPGENLRLYWGPQPDTGISELHLADRYFGIRGPIEPARKVGRGTGLIAAGYTISKRPINQGGSELILSPPDNDSERPFLRQIYIQHRDTHESEARALAGRLEFVSGKDARCRG